MSARLSEAELAALRQALLVTQCSGLLKMSRKSAARCSETWIEPVVEQILAARLAGVEETVQRVLGEHRDWTDRCSCGWKSVHGIDLGVQFRAHVAERVAVELGGGV